ncbi:MAG TPA: ribosome maturation factor RimM [Clostridia bacterium]|nr:ribosome maturation factor RimM [Clostridia bacterium]
MVALVRGVHGLRGAVRVEVLTDRPADRFVPGAVLHREGGDDSLTIASAEPVADGPGWRLRFREVADRTAADALRGAYLEAVVDRDRELARGEYYWHEVVGTAVRGVDGAELGTVRDVYRVGETEVFEVAGGPFGAFDLPAVRAFIRVFAPRRGEIVVDAAALDLGASPERDMGVERPRAPRRRSGSRRATPPEAGAAPEAGATAEPGPVAEQ